MIDVIMTTALAASAVKVVTEALRQYSARGGKTKSLQIDGREVRIDNIPPHLLESLKIALRTEEKIGGDPISMTRKAVAADVPAEAPSTVAVPSRPRREIEAAAFAISPEAVFRDARRRIDLVFRLNLGIAITLAVILLGAIGGALFSALFFNNTIWTIVFGGISAADVIGVYAFKPLKAINAALVATQRIDGIHLRLHQQLQSCLGYSDLEERIRCQTATWEAMQRELAALSVIP